MFTKMGLLFSQNRFFREQTGEKYQYILQKTTLLGHFIQLWTINQHKTWYDSSWYILGVYLGCTFWLY